MSPKIHLKVNVVDADDAGVGRVPVVAVKRRQLVNDVERDDAAMVDVTRQLVQRRQKSRQAEQRVAMVHT